MAWWGAMKENNFIFSCINNIKFVLIHAQNEKRPLLRNLTAYTISKSLQLTLNVVTIKIILNILLENVTDKSAVFAVLALGLGSFIAANMEAVSWNNYWPLVVRIRFDFLSMLGQKAMRLDYPATENPVYLEKLEAARAATSDNKRGIAGLLINLSKITPAAISCVICAGLILSTVPIAIFPILICPVINFRFSQWYKKIQFREEYQISEDIERKKEIFNSIFWDFKYGKEIRVFNLGGILSNHFSGLLNRQAEGIKKIEWAKFTNRLISKIVIIILETVAYLIVLIWISRETIGISDFFMLIGVFEQILLLVEELLETISDIQKNNIEISCFQNFMNMPQQAELTSKKSIPKTVTSLEFKNVFFHYPNTTRDVLKNVSFSIHRGEHIALVGLNGSGKSTILKLLMRLYEPSEGEILLNGQNVQEFDLMEYYALFSTMFQDVRAYAFSVAENISMGAKFDEVKLRSSIERSGLNEVVQKLPKKENTSLLKLVDDAGVEFSGGEMQKLAFARAIYKNASIVLLDEPTAALDAISEEQMFTRIADFIKDRTAIVITHRLSCTKEYDKILYLESGEIIESGAHQDLIAIDGRYAALFRKQADLYESGVTQ